VKAITEASLLITITLMILAFYCYTFHVYTQLYESECSRDGLCRFGYSYPSRAIAAQAVFTVILNSCLFLYTILEGVVYLFMLGLSKRLADKLIETLLFKAYLLPGRCFFALLGADDRQATNEYLVARIYFNQLLRHLTSLVTGIAVALTGLVTQSRYWIYLLVFWIPFLLQYAIFILFAFYLLLTVFHGYLKRSVDIEEVGQNRQVVVALHTSHEHPPTGPATGLRQPATCQRPLTVPMPPPLPIQEVSLPRPSGVPSQEATATDQSSHSSSSPLSHSGSR
jgi:hypothetical protein